MCVCLTKLGSVKQWLNLCKQAPGIAPRLPACCVGRGLKGTNPLGWVRVTNVDVYVHVFVCACRRPKLQDKEKTW